MHLIKTEKIVMLYIDKSQSQTRIYNPESLANNKLLKRCPRKSLLRKKTLVVITVLEYFHSSSSGQRAFPIPLN